MAGGWTIFAGADSPLSQALGIGLHGPVHEAELDAIEKFLSSRGAKVSLDVCPLAHPSLIEGLHARGYRVTEFNNVLVKPLAGGEIVFTPRVRRAMAGESDLWSHTVGRGFFEQVDLDPRRKWMWGALYSRCRSRCATSPRRRMGSRPEEPRCPCATAWRSCLRTAP